VFAENIQVKRNEWGSNRLDAHLGDVMRHLHCNCIKHPLSFACRALSVTLGTSFSPKCCPHPLVVFAENIRVKRNEWGTNRLEAHLGDVMRHLGQAFASAGAAAAAGGGRAQPLQLPKLTPAGIDLLQVG
jgi:hypothetical protein